MQRTKSRIHPTSIEGFFFLLSSILLAIYSLVLHVLSKAKWKMSPYLFPLLLAVFLFLLSLSLLQEGGKEKLERERMDSEGQEQALEGSPLQKDVMQDETGKATNLKGFSLFASLLQKGGNDALVFALISLVYVLSIGFIGFVVATTLFLASSFVYLKERRAVLVIALSIAFPLIVYVLFGMLLHVMLP